ncbi:Citron Rho-interacting kinase [Armadillidium nasatum]|uniref:Citron Rho-interacting kinase n=1 Tax=Armadillidium nasatum TaxID=96803 RepID=A0A5N5SQE7_9CRUS|nr:Citron Rho-interacting kinase [Armadillidium nasatum]
MFVDYSGTKTFEKRPPNPATTQPHRVMEDLTNSPLHEKQPRERMKHKIPHRWQSHLVVRPGRCIGCLGSVPFSRNGVKCNECGVIAHTKFIMCSKNIANTCGLPDGFAHHYSQSRAKSNCDEQCSQDSTKILMKGWIKIPRSGKATWDKTYACLNEKELCYYDQQPIPSLQPLKKFNLDTKNSRIAILHSVPIEDNQATTTIPVYIMTSSFEDKQLWISALESAIQADESKDDYKGSLESHTLLSLNSVTSLDINTVVFLNSRTALVGAVEGLFSFACDENRKLSFRARIEGISSVFEILLVKSIGVAAKDNFLYHTNLELLKVAADASQMAKPSIKICNIEPQITCHLISASQHTKRVFICAAAENRISIFWWCDDKQSFEVCRQYSTQEPCSCFQFTPTSLIVGAERFYKINLKNFEIDEYLDESDTSLAYAIYGSAQMSSFPVAIIQVSGSGKHEEYLLVFYEFGIFVDSHGRRTREFDLKFVRLPVAIVFCPPYLYILHHNSVEVLEIKPESFTKVKGMSFDSDSECAPFIRNAFKDVNETTVYSVEDHFEIISLRANFPEDLDSSVSWSMNTSFQAQKYGAETTSVNSETSFNSDTMSQNSSLSTSTLKRSKLPNFMRASKRSKKSNNS